jgi:argininosuccinate lyase
VGQLVREGERRGMPWSELPLADLQKFSPLFQSDLRDALTLDAALSSRDVPGGTAPARVREGLADCRRRLAQWEDRA